MKKAMLLGVALLVGGADEAAADCSGIQVMDTSIHEKAEVTFAGLSNANSVTVAGLTFTASGDLTSGQVAAAFASLFSGATTGSGSGYGTYSGTLSGWNSGGAVTSIVRFTSVDSGNVTNISTAGVAQVVTTDGLPSLADLLTGHTVCVGTSGNWEAQEYHQSGGNLIDWKKGASDPVDPTAQVGTWAISGTLLSTRVNYTYGSTTYVNTVWIHLNGTYSFCNTVGNETIPNKIIAGQQGC